MKTLALAALAFCLPSFAADFSCSGTEPFWGLRHNKKETKFDMIGEEYPLKTKGTTLLEGQSAHAGEVLRAETIKGQKLTLIMVKAPGCSDGMSERKYDAYGVLDFNGERVHYGCCSPGKLKPEKAPKK